MRNIYLALSNRGWEDTGRLYAAKTVSLKKRIEEVFKPAKKLTDYLKEETKTPSRYFSKRSAAFKRA